MNLNARLAHCLGITWIAALVIGFIALITLKPLLLFACVIICPTAYVAMLLLDPEPSPPPSGEPTSCSSLADPVALSLLFGCGWLIFVIGLLLAAIIYAAAIGLLIALFLL